MKCKHDKSFRLHWRTGQVEDVKGRTIQEAMTLAGYGFGAVRALDYWEEIKAPTDDEAQSVRA